MDETLQSLLGGGLPPGLLTPQQETAAEQRARNAGLLNLAFGMLQASRGAPGQRAPSLGQVIGAAGPAGVQAYQQSFDQTLQNLLKGLQVRSMVSEMGAPKYMTIKTPSGGEQIIQIPRGGGTPTPVQIPGLDMSGKPIPFDDQTQAFIRRAFNKPFEQLTADQQSQVIAFAQAPDERQAAELRAKIAEAMRDQPQTFQIPMPKTRTEILNDVLKGITGPQVSPATTPQVSPVTPPTAPRVGPVSQVAPEAVTTAGEVGPAPAMVRTSGPIATIPASAANQPLARNETPLINNLNITPKQKTELEVARPQAFTSVESALNITRQIRNSINQLLEDKNFNLAFGFGGETVSQYYTPAANIRAKLDQIKNQLFVEGITAMRNASPTGAGVGSVTQQEGTRFENLRGALVQFQSADQAKAELQRIEKELADSERRLQNGFNRVYGSTTFDVTPLYTTPKQGDLKSILFPKR